MNTRNVSLDIMEFVEQNILPRYAMFDKAHNLSHVNSVIKRSLTLALTIGADIDMAYVIAAYHDLGLDGPRAIHHITGGKILASDARLRRWFSPEQIKIMREAVEDPRPTATSALRQCSGAPCSMVWHTTPKCRRRSTGHASPSTWTTSTHRTDTSSCGYRTPPTRSRSTTYATSSTTPRHCAGSLTNTSMRSGSERIATLAAHKRA